MTKTPERDKGRYITEASSMRRQMLLPSQAAVLLSSDGQVQTCVPELFAK